MSKRLVIIGAGGHGKAVADAAMNCGLTDIVFLDDNAVGECLGFPIVGKISDAYSLAETCPECEFIAAIGDNAIRKRITTEYNLNWATVIHPTAVIASDTRIGEGTVILTNAVVNVSATVGRHCIINTGAVVEHDNLLGDLVQIAPKAVLGGTVRVGNEAHIGIGATVRNNISICDACLIGAGAVVVKDITEPAVYVGVPAKLLRRL